MLAKLLEGMEAGGVSRVYLEKRLLKLYSAANVPEELAAVPQSGAESKWLPCPCSCWLLEHILVPGKVSGIPEMLACFLPSSNFLFV